MNLENLSTTDLEKLKADVERAIVERKKQDIKEAREAIKATAAKFGFSLAELLAEDTGKAEKTKSAVAPKYRHPENPALTWSGRGRKPQWFTQALEAGKSITDLEI